MGSGCEFHTALCGPWTRGTGTTDATCFLSLDPKL